MTLQLRREAVEMVVRALRTGEASAAALASRLLSEDVAMATPKGRIEGRAAVADRLTGQWPQTPVLAGGAWTIAANDEGGIDAEVSYANIGAAPRAGRFRFAFDAEDRIATITETQEAHPRGIATPAMSPQVRRRLDRAMAEGAPVTVGYVDDEGAPALTLRSSVQTYDDTTLCLWIRDAGGGLARAIAAGRPIAFLYRHNPSRTTLTGRGRGEIVADARLRRLIYDSVPEADQRHDPALAGAAALIHVETLRGTSPEGPVLVVPERAA